MALAGAWRLRAASMEYLPVGGGAHHWVVTGEDGRRHFVTVDDLDGKDWLGGTRDAVLTGLCRALGTAAALRAVAGLEFVVAPVPAMDGQPVSRLGGRYAVSVFPFLDTPSGRSHPFGRYRDERLRRQALQLVAALHRSTAAVRALAPDHVLGFSGRGDLEAFLRDPARPWDGGPYSQAAHRLTAARATDIARIAAGFGQLADATAAARSSPVITHGEPHPANLMSVDGGLALIDWDTVGLAPPERDVSLIAARPADVGYYELAAGRQLDPAVITVYRLRWYLDDLASAVRMFRGHHGDTADTRLWLQGLPPRLGQLTHWLDQLD
jgi:spectinomycin phosphotransferase